MHFSSRLGHGSNTQYCIQVWNPYLETGHGTSRESAKKSHKNDPGLQGFELQGKVEKVWTNNTGEKEEQRRLNRNS